MQRWTADRFPELVALVDAALPDEGLGPDDLLACSFEDDGVVLGATGGDGAVVAVTRSIGDVTVGFVQIVAVAPSARRVGVGRRLLTAAEAWMVERGATHAALGGSAPWYLWPGVDVTATPMLCLAEAAGYQPVGAELDMALDVAFRAPTPEGVSLVRALDDDVVADALAFVAGSWPHWVAEVGRAVEHGTCLVALLDGRPVGVACHSVNRAARLGPMATDPSHRGAGIGAALVGEVCRDLMVAGHRRVEISWVGPVRFYAKLGAEVSRAYRTYRKRLG